MNGQYLGAAGRGWLTPALILAPATLASHGR